MKKRKTLIEHIRDDWDKTANLITEGRLLFSFLPPLFIFLWPDISQIWWAALILFIVIASTDALDGHVARKFDQVTELGTFMDPLVDKVLIILSLFSLSWHFGTKALWILTAIVCLREFSVTCLRVYAKKTVNVVIAAAKSGKHKMISQAIFVGMLFFTPIVLSLAFVQIVTGWLVIVDIAGFAMAALTIYSGGEYFYNLFSGKYKPIQE